MTTLALKPISWFKVNDQVRKTFDEQDLRRLGESLRQKQLQPVLCQPDGTIIAGERRYRAAKLVGLATLEAKVADTQLDEVQVKIWRLTENMLRSDLTGHEKWLGCSELLSINSTWRLADVAEHLHLDPSMVTRILSPSRCIPEVQEALKQGKITISDTYAISKLNEPEQAGLLAMKLNGASRDQLEQAGRKRRSHKSATITTKRVKIDMPHGASVVLTGNALGMAEVVDLLNETLKEARKAMNRYDVLTWKSMMKDQAKAGGKQG